MNKNSISVQQDSVVASLQRASNALAEAKTIQQTKQIIDVAAAAEIYAKRQQLGEENIAIAHSIKLEALRKLGEMLKSTPKNEGQILRGTKMEPRENQPQTLAELGLDKKTSAIAQKLAELPQEAFEQVRDGHETIAKAIAAVNEINPKAEQKIPTKQKPEEPAHLEKDVLQPEEDYSELDSLHDQITELQNIVAAGFAGTTDEDRASGLKLIADLRQEIKTLNATLDAVTISRDTFQRENAELKKQLARQRKEIEKLSK